MSRFVLIIQKPGPVSAPNDFTEWPQDRASCVRLARRINRIVQFSCAAFATDSIGTEFAPQTTRKSLHRNYHLVPDLCNAIVVRNTIVLVRPPRSTWTRMGRLDPEEVISVQEKKNAFCRLSRFGLYGPTHNK